MSVCLGFEADGLDDVARSGGDGGDEPLCDASVAAPFGLVRAHARWHGCPGTFPKACGTRGSGERLCVGALSAIVWAGRLEKKRLMRSDEGSFDRGERVS